MRRVWRLIKRAWMLRNDPDFIWSAFYWLSFAWVVILDGGLKIVLTSLRYRRDVGKSIGLFER